MTKRALCPLTLVLCLGTATPLLAGTFYVPYAANATIRGGVFATKIRVHNDSDAATTLRYLFVAGGASSVGIDRDTAATSLVVAPHATVTFGNWVPNGQVGWIEVEAGPEVVMTARLVATSSKGTKTFGTEIPVVTQRNAVAAGEAALLPGLARKAGDKITDMVLLNLDAEAAECAVEVFKASGARALAQEVAVPGLGSAALADLLSIAGLAEANDVTVAVTCDRIATSLAVVQSIASAQTLLVPPAGGGADAFPAPGECAVGGVCLENLGLVHAPTPGDPVGRLVFDAPAGTFRRIKLSLDVTVGDWYDPDPDGKHLIYWFVINKNLDMLGMLYFRGPDAFTALVRHGIGLAHADKFKLVDQGFEAQVGHTYHCVNDYDMGSGEYTVTITDKATGEVESVIRGVPNVASVSLSAGDDLIVDMAFPEGGVDEVPAYGWKFRDVEIELTP